MSVRKLLLIFAMLAGSTVVAAAPANAATADAWGYAITDPITPAAWAAPSTLHQWGSWKSTHPLEWAEARKLGIGRYQVRFPRLFGAVGGVVHVTAVSAASTWCAPLTWFSSGIHKVVEVNCTAPGAGLTDSRFTVLYTTSSGVLPAGQGTHAYVRTTAAGGITTAYNSTGGANAVVKLGIGRYQVTLPGAGVAAIGSGNLQATAITATSIPPRCKVNGWSTGPNVVAIVHCFQSGGALMDAAFSLSYHRERAVTGELAPPKNFAYVWSPGGGQTSYNGQGGSNSIVDIGPVYQVTMTRVNGPATHAQTTGFGPGPGWCLLHDPWFLIIDGELVLMEKCVDVNGIPVNAPFFATYTSSV
jgi:hypothetical protein